MIDRHPILDQETNEHDRKTVYLTNEQAHRIAALSLDALSGVQIHTTDNCLDAALIDLVSIDEPSRTEHFVVFTDGSVRRTT